VPAPALKVFRATSLGFLTSLTPVLFFFSPDPFCLYSLAEFSLAPGFSADICDLFFFHARRLAFDVLCYFTALLSGADFPWISYELFFELRRGGPLFRG